ncbi:hypothetical protein HPB48_007937 [Haemaphysalis longicornis]|uniref:Uncharacterized protein n=1 Tax=Haemaphysalis longicornis TaxID=44386 RepID=A0A9J6FB33_HAELO|nr:hypothetical protein HPB48_007937 [Haemaphysalis longicornis]
MPFVGVTYKIKPTDCKANMSERNIRAIRPLGHGPAGPLTKIPGILSLPEVCDKVDASWQKKDLRDSKFDSARRDSYHFACKGDEAIAYPTAITADDTVRKLMRSTEDSCMGAMNPEYDDFAGVCKKTLSLDIDIYPIVRGIFRAR